MIPHAAIRNACRKLWLWSPQRRDAKKAAKLSPGLYLCAVCQRATKDKDTEIDHAIPVGPTPGSRLGVNRSWDDFMRALFCPAHDLRVMCRSCHEERTKASRNKSMDSETYKAV